ncbi:3'-5' exonuclease DinG [Austwickia sp. TVS 96-490-7B]|uniref:exonuclease domain-containing protein n=1 Tax=Austwickia sp. TVS 96-490-7B TaxID=2830843 RepID=UPI001C571C55|nr:exonuclease domain-containing protein [Austwickia sp. TVS 96-490-7B]MBW3085027.1 3'-5' exonuclease DinG [Austwickia sp. TVS 96-490-7B]
MGGALIWLVMVATAAAVVWAFLPRPAQRSPTPSCAEEKREPTSSPRPMPTSGPAPSTARAEISSRAAAPGNAGPRSAETPPRAASTSASRRTALFAEGVVAATSSTAEGFTHDGPYACLQVMTSGFSPARDRVVEVAVVRCDATGTVQREWTTMIDPARSEISGTAVHGLTSGVLQGAPGFAETATALFAEVEGCVLVVHQARMVEAFVAAECLRAGVLAPTMPVVDMSSWAASVWGLPNPRLATVARHVGLRRTVPSSALDDARICAAVVPLIAGRCGDRLRYPVPPVSMDATDGRHRGEPRWVARPGGSAGIAPHSWLADLLSTVPMSAAETHDPRSAALVEAITSVLPVGRIVTADIRDLTAAAARAGLPATQIRAVTERLLESMRRVTFAQGVPSQDQVRQLRGAAHSLGVPGYFDDLVQQPPAAAPLPGSGSFSRPVRKPLPPPPSALPRCGRCLRIGHYVAQCPRGAGALPPGPVTPTRSISPVDPI